MRDAVQSSTPAHPPPEGLDLQGVSAGSYRLERLIGWGGLASVWLARHAAQGTTVAVKVLHHPGTEARARLAEEASAANRLHSPYILPILGIGTLADDRPYAVMEYLRGQTLSSYLRREGALSWPSAYAIATQIAEALLTAHGAGVIHRDLKPDNVFLIDGSAPERPLVKLLDFGIAEVVAESSRGTGQSPRPAIHGTPHYIAPEQALGEPCGPSADIYAFGAVLFQMLAGEPPFSGDVTQVLAAKCRQAPPRLDEHRDDLDVAIVDMVHQMLSSDPEQRPVSLQVVVGLRDAAALDTAATAGCTPTAPSLRPPSRKVAARRGGVEVTIETGAAPLLSRASDRSLVRWRRAIWRGLAAGLVVGLLLALALVLAAQQSDEAQRRGLALEGDRPPASGAAAPPPTGNSAR